MLCNAIEIKGPFNSEIVFNKMHRKVFGSIPDLETKRRQLLLLSKNNG